MNVELLRKVQAYILAVPERFNLNLWGAAVEPAFFNNLHYYDDESYSEPEEVLARQKPPCGAVGCIAGNACIVAGIINPKLHIGGAEIYEFPDNTLEIAAEALQISEDAAKRLFYLSDWQHRDSFNNFIGWPRSFEAELQEYQPGTKEYAEVTVRRIEHFITTQGAE